MPRQTDNPIARLECPAGDCGITVGGLFPPTFVEKEVKASVAIQITNAALATMSGWPSRLKSPVLIPSQKYSSGRMRFSKTGAAQAHIDSVLVECAGDVVCWLAQRELGADEHRVATWIERTL